MSDERIRSLKSRLAKSEAENQALRNRIAYWEENFSKLLAASKELEEAIETAALFGAFEPTINVGGGNG